jgi:hypothetical protein
MPDDWTWHHGVPFRFRGNAILVGTNPLNGGTADYPEMSLYEFRRLVTFISRLEPSVW